MPEVEPQEAHHVGREQALFNKTNRRNQMKMIVVAAMLLSGCINSGSGSAVSGHGQVQQSGSNVSYLCVGMETSKRFGACPGCELDAKRLASLMKTRMGHDGEILISGQATKSEVVQRLKKGIERTPEDGLFMFFYSGHGGQENLGGKEPDGADRPDEYLCLYDTYMMDDEIWDIVSKCKGRVFLYFDACHSATMYRSVASEKLHDDIAAKKGTDVATALAVDVKEVVSSKGFTFDPNKFVKAKPLDGSSGSSPRILCWSGCKEEEYSYGGNNGGTLTICVVNNWKQGISYSALFDSAYHAVNDAQKTQHPVETRIGLFQTFTEAFR